MAQIVVTEYQAKIDQYLSEIDKLKSKVRSVADEQQRGVKNENENTKTLRNAIAVRNNLLKQELRTLQQLKEQRARAFSVSEIDQYNKKIAETQRNINSLKSASSSAAGSFSSMSAGLKSIAGGIAAAFSVQAIKAFAQQTIDAFLEAEKSANLLRYAIVNIGNESEVQFNRLLTQSKQLQNITVFDDEQIQQAQAALSAFGLTAAQIENLMPLLADFASIIGTDLPTAASKVGVGLQGSGRDFKRFGIDVSAANTEFENYRLILEGLEKFTGSAANAAKTYAGQLEQQKNKVSELSEEVGGKLTPAWVQLKAAILDATRALLIQWPNLRQANAVDSFIEAFSRGAASVKATTKELQQSGKTNEEIIATIDSLAQAEENRNKRLIQRIKNEEKAGKTFKQLKQLMEDAQFSSGIIKSLKDQAEALREIELQNLRILKSEELRQYSLIDLNALLAENKKGSDIVAQSNVKVLEREIELRAKAADETKKQADKYRQELLRQEAAIIQMINKLRIERASPEDKLAIQLEIDKASLDKQKEDMRSASDILLSIEKNRLDATRLLNEKYTEDLLGEIEKQVSAQADADERILKERLRIANETRQRINRESLANLDEGSNEYLERQKQILTEEYNLKKLNIEATVKDSEDAANQLVNLYLDYADKIKAIDKSIVENNQKNRDINIEQLTEMLSMAAGIYGSITDIFISESDERITQMERELSATQEKYDREAEMLSKQRQGKYISERQYQDKLMALEERKMAQERKIQAEIRKEKRKQAEIERGLRLFEIAINTAAAIMKVTGQTGILSPLFIPSIIALGAVQAAAVLAAPLPKFAKGTKRKKDSGLAVVGEQGEEVINLPAGSQVLHNKGYKRHREAINAMMDGRFDNFVYVNYVLPELKRAYKDQARQAQQAQQPAVNVESNAIDEYGMMRIANRGVRVSNADEIAMMIAMQLKTDIRRRL